MGLRSWSKKMRQQDYSLQWIVSAGKESADATGSHSVDVYLNDTTLESNISIVKSIEETSKLNEEFDALANIDTDTAYGQVIRGLSNITKPTASPSTPSKFDLSSYYRLVVKNTGTSPVVITSLYASLRKIYPGETLDQPESHDADCDPADIITFNEIYSAVLDESNPYSSLKLGADMVNEIYPAELTQLFSGLSSTTAESELSSIINDSAFVDFYKNVFPKSVILPKARFGKLVDGEFVLQELPITLQPNETAAYAFTRHVANYFYNPLDLD